ncbi:MAG: UDP-N-acetylmuramoyl-L-alanyl-D-glutamate--2,6-diaminopimelate ligase [Kiritimatiellae bacterium]|nr:UDP-N-acetylmuramoyl-L-alanyl-D-glutamate--2,6-diaminopimelate ligase [Kiritimatiellia bacterium]
MYKRQKLKSLVGQIRGRVLNNLRDVEVTGVTCDSRQVRPGNIFVALKGQRQSGLDFVDDAIARGAIAVVSEEAGSRNRAVCQVVVDDARLAYAQLAASFHNYPSRHLRMIGVTGTNGKTTVCYMIRDILRAEGFAPGMIGTVQYELGSRIIPASRTTPDAGTLQSFLAQMLNAGCRSVVMEVSSHAVVQHRIAAIEYDTAVFTNLTRDHLDYHQTQEHYFEAKAGLFRGLVKGSKQAAAVINFDCPWGKRLVAEMRNRIEVLTYGADPGADIRLEEIHISAEGSSFRAHTPWGVVHTRIPHIGRFNVSNALAALAVCGRMGISARRLADLLPTLERVPGRLEEVPCQRGYRVFVDYAHTDDALKNVLTVLREIVQGRLILVFGCGGNRDKTKRAPMGRIAAELADFSIVTSDNPRNEAPAAIIKDILAGFEGHNNYAVVEDRRSAIHTALNKAQSGDVVLIAGKGHETFQEFASTTVPFDDRQVAKEILDET